MTFNIKTVLVIFFPFLLKAANAQTEFPNEWIAHVRLKSGMITSKSPAPELFVGGLEVIPQVTIIKHTLRGGLVAGGFYAHRELNGLLGPTASLKIAEFKGGFFGSVGNIHLNLDHLWGTDQQRLVGGGVNLDLLNKLIVGLTTHRDYNLNNWWIQSSVAIRISKVKQPQETFPH